MTSQPQGVQEPANDHVWPSVPAQMLAAVAGCSAAVAAGFAFAGLFVGLSGAGVPRWFALPATFFLAFFAQSALLWPISRSWRESRHVPPRDVLGGATREVQRSFGILGQIAFMAMVFVLRRDLLEFINESTLAIVATAASILTGLVLGLWIHRDYRGLVATNRRLNP